MFAYFGFVWPKPASSGDAAGGGPEDEEDGWLGAYGTDKFTFGQMREFDVHVDVVGGNALGDGGPGVDKWWAWIADKI